MAAQISRWLHHPGDHYMTEGSRNSKVSVSVPNQRATKSNLMVAQVVAVYMSQSALFKTLNLFPPEKALVNVERAKGSYNVLPYFLSKVLAELPLAAVYPFVFSSIVYPMTGLQPSVRSAQVMPIARALRKI